MCAAQGARGWLFPCLHWEPKLALGWCGIPSPCLLPPPRGRPRNPPRRGTERSVSLGAALEALHRVRVPAAGPVCTQVEAPGAQPAWWAAGEGGAGRGRGKSCLPRGMEDLPGEQVGLGQAPWPGGSADHWVVPEGPWQHLVRPLTVQMGKLRPVTCPSPPSPSVRVGVRLAGCSCWGPWPWPFGA